MEILVASVLAIAATLPLSQALASVSGLPLQQLDTPAYTEDSLYFPQPGSGAWVNPNSTLRPRVSGNDDPFPMAECYGVPIEEATIDQLQDWMTNGNLTSRQLTVCYLGRILQVNEYVK
jgi:hypothetical protein